MQNNNDWSIVAFKHGKYAILEKGIVSQTLARSQAKAFKKQSEYQNIYVREVKSTTVNNLMDLLTKEELLNLK